MDKRDKNKGKEVGSILEHTTKHGTIKESIKNLK